MSRLRAAPAAISRCRLRFCVGLIGFRIRLRCGELAARFLGSSWPLRRRCDASAPLRTSISVLDPVGPWIRSQRLSRACVRRAVGVETLRHPSLRWGLGLALGPAHRDGLSARSTGTLGFHRFGGQAWRLRRAVGDGESCLRGLFVVVGFGSAVPLVGSAGVSAIFGAALTTVKVQSVLGIRLCSMRRTARLSCMDLAASAAPAMASACAGCSVVSAAVSCPSGSAEFQRVSNLGCPHNGASFAASDLCYGVGQVRS